MSSSWKNLTAAAALCALIGMGTVPAAADPAEAQAFVEAVQMQGLTDELKSLFGLELPASGPVEAKALGQAGDLFGDLTYRGDNVPHFLTVLERAARLHASLSAPGSEGRLTTFNSLYGTRLTAGRPSEEDVAVLFSVAGSPDHEPVSYQEMLGRVHEILARLRQEPALLADHNVWNGTSIQAEGGITTEDAASLFGLAGDPAFVPAEYLRLLPGAIRVWRHASRLNDGRDFNLIYGTQLDPAAVHPSAEERGLIMGIVGGYWGGHLNEHESFNYFRVLAEAAQYFTDLQSSPGLLDRYNRRFGTKDVPPLPAQGPIAEPKAREKLLYLISQAVLKRMPIQRYLSTYVSK
jgi:hypothetical protein